VVARLFRAFKSVAMQLIRCYEYFRLLLKGY